MCQEIGINGSDHPNLPLLKSGLFHPMIDGSPFDPKFLWHPTGATWNITVYGGLLDNWSFQIGNFIAPRRKDEKAMLSACAYLQDVQDVQVHRRMVSPGCSEKQTSQE